MQTIVTAPPDSESDPAPDPRTWDAILESLRSRLPSQQAFDTWFRPLRLKKIERGLIAIEVPNLFFVDWIKEHYLEPLAETAAKLMGDKAPVIRFSVCPDLESTEKLPSNLSDEPPAEPRSPAVPAPGGNGISPDLWGGPRRHAMFSPSEPWLNPRFTFSTFVVGTSNELTHATCLAVAENPGFTYNPLFIYGGVGLGKTHLMHAIGHAVLERRSDARVRYISAERFMNEMIFAIQRGQQLGFREKYRNVDLLLIDDIQFLAGKDGTQEEFFYTFGALHEAHKQIVLTSDKPPRDIKNLEERLVSRFNQGMVTDVKPPDLETRVAILRRLAAAYGHDLPNEVALLIASRVRANVRHLEGVLVRLTALTRLGGTKLSKELAEEVLQDYASPEEKAVTPERIVQVVADQSNLPVDVLRGKRRTNNIALPRQIAMYLIRKLTNLSLSDIGAHFKRDHTTVLHACGKIEALREKDAKLAATLRELLAKLNHTG